MLQQLSGEGEHLRAGEGAGQGRGGRKGRARGPRVNCRGTRIGALMGTLIKIVMGAHICDQALAHVAPVLPQQVQHVVAAQRALVGAQRVERLRGKAGGRVRPGVRQWTSVSNVCKEGGGWNTKKKGPGGRLTGKEKKRKKHPLPYLHLEDHDLPLPGAARPLATGPPIKKEEMSAPSLTIAWRTT